MRRLRAWFLRLAGLFGKERREQELAEEMESHLQLHTEDNLRAGMNPSEARRNALIKLGGLEATKELYRERRGLPLFDTLIQDVRYALRTLGKNLGFTTIAVITLALGIGANVAIFSMVNALLLHPYDFRDLDRLVHVWEDRGVDEGFDARWIAPQDAVELHSETQIFDGFTTYADRSFNLSTDGGVQPVRGCRVSATFFDVLGVSPAAGRTFSQAEMEPGADGVAIISHGFWLRRFGGDPALLGRTIQANQRSYTIVGIMPPGFSFPLPSELWVPLALTSAEKADRAKLSLEALGRLRNGVSVPQARAALTGVARMLERDYPITNAGRTVEVLQLRRELYFYTLPMFGLLQAAAGFVLLLAGANLASLLFARVIGRQREIAVRTALGASRSRLTQLFVTEMFLLSSLAGAVAITVSFWSVRLLRTSISEDWTRWVPGWSGIQVDRTALAFAILLATVVGILCGLATALHSSSVHPYSTLKETSRGPMLPGRGRIRGGLVTAQMTFALVLLVCAGLTAQGFLHLADVYKSFDPANVLRMEISLPERSYLGDSQIRNFYQPFLRKTDALPDVQFASIVSNTPASNVDNETSLFTIEGRPLIRATEAPSADLVVSSPDYFRVLRIRLLVGREFSDADHDGAAPVVVISKTMAARFWPNGDELGHRLKVGAVGSADPWMTVVGVVDDVRQNWWNPVERAVIYRPFSQAPRRGMAVLVRASANPTNQAPAVRDIVREQDAEIAVREVGTMETEIADSIAIVRIMGVLMGIFGAVALALASVGVYGMLAESVARRTPEIGIRLALGASPHEVMKLVLSQALRLTGIGLAIGLPLSFVVNRAMASLIFGMVGINVGMLAGSAVLLIIVAMVAGYVPARRAMRVDPMVALRYE